MSRVAAPAFDAAGPTECYRRAVTVVPQQAMALVNSRLSVRAAEAVAKDLARKSAEAVVAGAFVRVLGRAPTADEADVGRDYLRENSTASLVQALFSHTDFTTIR